MVFSTYGMATAAWSVKQASTRQSETQCLCISAIVAHPATRWARGEAARGSKGGISARRCFTFATAYAAGLRLVQASIAAGLTWVPVSHYWRYFHGASAHTGLPLRSERVSSETPEKPCEVEIDEDL